ncbi:MAG TPA: hypothetical protein VJP40_05145, partial [bacterium]|nr:hypothetical protein [bacterium]
LHLRNRNPAVWESHLVHLETVLLDAKLPARDYLALYQRLQAELGESDNPANRKIAETLSDLLSRISLRQPGPRLLFDTMIHIDRFPDHSLGDTLSSWARNPSLQPQHRRKMLRLAEDIFCDQPRDYGEEALGFLSSNWHRFSGEGRVFRRTVDSALRFIDQNNAWFEPLDGLGLVRMALLDPGANHRSRDLILNRLQATLHSNEMLSEQRVKVMQTLEELAQRPDLNEEQRELFFSRLSIWRNEFLYFNSQRAVRNRVSHHAELAYLITKDYVILSQKRSFARALEQAFFESPPESRAYSMMIGDALRYLGNPDLVPEFRRTFAMQILKALNDSARVGSARDGLSREVVTAMNQRYLVEKIVSLPEEERLGLVYHLLEEMIRRDGQAERAGLLLSTLTRLVNPTPALMNRFSEIAESSQDPEARETAQYIIQRWQLIN